MRDYVVVCQHNWREERVDKSGRKYTAITCKLPENVEQARDWPGTKVIRAEKPPVHWGHGTYAENADGKLELVAHDWDSSG